MKALIFDGQLRLVENHPEPAPAAGDVLIKTCLAGICNTDLEIVQGYAAFAGILGHEFVGVVERADDPEWIGQRVVGEINVPCSQCPSCRAGRTKHCLQRTALGIRGRSGALAEYLSLPTGNLHRVPDGVADEAAVFVEPLAAACDVLDQVHIRSTDRVLVLGDGKLGLLVAQVLALTGADLLVVGRHPQKLAILEERGIATRVGDQGLASGWDLVVECTGRPEGFGAACQWVRPAGTLLLKSTYRGPTSVDLSSLVVDEIRVIGSRCGPFATALRLLERGWVDVSPLIEAEYPLDQALPAFSHARRPGTLKVLVRPYHAPTLGEFSRPSPP